MRGSDERSGALFSYVDLEARVPAAHPLRTPDDARRQLADRVLQHLEQSGFEIDEAAQVMRKRPPSANHG